MKRFACNTDKGSFLFIKVPKAVEYFYHYNMIECVLSYGSGKVNSRNRIVDIKVPEGGDFSFIGVSGSITEQEASMVVGDNGAGFYDNYRLQKREKYTCSTAIDSLHCLLITCGVNMDVDNQIIGNYAILKINKNYHEPDLPKEDKILSFPATKPRKRTPVNLHDTSDAEQKQANHEFNEFMKFAPQSQQDRLQVAQIVDKAIKLKDTNIDLLSAMRKIVACCEDTGNPMDIVTADIYSIANEALKNNQ